MDIPAENGQHTVEEPLAQSVEQLPFKQRVTGSIPVRLIEPEARPPEVPAGAKRMADFGTAPPGGCWYTRAFDMGHRCAQLFLLLLVWTSWSPTRADAAPCPTTATLSVYADNESDDDTLTLHVSGQLLDESSTCSVQGEVTYETTLNCTGSGSRFCGVIPGLRPGAWAHTVTTTVTGSDEQHQATQLVLVGADGGGSNVLEWTIYPRTFVVDTLVDDEFHAEIAAAKAYTASHAGRFALVTFARESFPSAQSPGVIPLGFTVLANNQHQCEASVLCGKPARQTRICLDASRIVVDALDDRGEPGAAVLTIGKCATSLMRIVGSDNTLRGLDLVGSLKTDPTIPLDTLVFSGATARRNRLEHAIVRGPTMGDGVSIEGGAGAPDGATAADIVLEDTTIMGAEDKGVKVRDGSHLTVADSCVHDNRNGGVQSTFGGHARVERSVVQFNVPGAAENGLSVGVPEDIAAESTLETDGNIIRFAGSRGVSIVNNASAVLLNDFVAENQDVGIRIETTEPGVTPTASLRGVAMACNHAVVSRECVSEAGARCVENNDCTIACGNLFIEGVGMAVGQCPTCDRPNPIDLGPSGADAGRNAFALNPRNSTSGGANFRNALLDTSPTLLVARGNQWEHCGTKAACDIEAVKAEDLRPAASVDIGAPSGPRSGPAPVIVDVFPRRPRKGDLVRVYNGVLVDQGGPFNAVDGVDCRVGGFDGPTGLPLGLPADRCDPRSAEVAAANHASVRGNKVEIQIGSETFTSDLIDVHAVTPTMLVFEMPVDCYAAGSLRVSRGSDASELLPFCDVIGCSGRPAGTRCDDGDACTVDDKCNAAGSCVPGPPLSCVGTCETGVCDQEIGCLLKPAGAGCEEGDLCTIGDACTAEGTCETGVPRNCGGDCLTGECTPLLGCVPRVPSTTCDDGNACTESDRCSGVDARCLGGPASTCEDDGEECTVESCDAEVGCVSEPADDGTGCKQVDACHGPATCIDGGCDRGPAIACDDGDICTNDACDETVGCTFAPLPAFEAMLCRVDEMRALIADAPGLKKAMAKKLNKRLRKIEGFLARAQSTNVTARLKRFLKKADVGLGAFLGMLNRADDAIEPTLVRALRRSAQDARTTITVLRADV